MSNKPFYQAARQGGVIKALSEYVLTLREPVTLDVLRQRAQQQSLLPELDASIDEQEDELHLVFQQDNAIYLYRVSLFTDEYTLSALEYTPRVQSIAPEILQQAAGERQRVSVVTRFQNNIFLSWQNVMKVMAVLAPDLLIGQDISAAGKLFAHNWLQFEARYPARPRVDSLYIIHAVHDDETDDYWLHTHGLERLGLPECEILFRRQVESLASVGGLIEAFANICLDNNGIDFYVPQWLVRTREGDQAIVAIPWEQGLDFVPFGGSLSDLPELDEMAEMLPAPTARFSGDRADRLEGHNGPSCLLFRLEDERGSVGCVLDGGLDDDRVMFMKSIALSDSEAHKAQLRWPYFQHVFETTSATEEALFIVKIGVPHGNADEREHMWFRLLSIGDEQLTGVLTNQPFYVQDMQQDEEYTLPLTLVSDWKIYRPGQEFNPDNIFEIISHS